MEEVVDFNLPSGAMLRFRHPPYTDAEALFRAVAAESVKIPINSQDELFNLTKTHICTVIASEPIQRALWKVMAASTYQDPRGDLKIDRATFEPIAAREDYPVVATEVLQATLAPFGKSLLLVFNRLSSLFGPGHE